MIDSEADNRLVGLAFIGALVDAEHKAYGDLVGSLVLRELAERTSGANAEELAASVGERLGMTFPAATVASALARRSLEGRVEQRGGVYYYVGRALPPLGIDRAAIARQQANLVSSLQGFAKDSFQEDWSVDEATRTLHMIVDRHAPALSLAKPVSVPTGDIPVIDRARGVIAAVWINGVLESDPVRSEYLFSLVKGRVIGAALVDVRRGEYQRKFRKTTIYLDTPEVLGALGLHGPGDRDAIRAGLRVANLAGARVAVLESTLTEVRNVIIQAQHSQSADRYRGPTRVRRYFEETGVSALQAREFADQLELSVSRRGFEIDVGASWDRTGAVDEDALREALRDFVHRPLDPGVPVGFDRGSAVDFDARALLSVYAARDRMAGDCLESARAVLLTSNTRLVRTANGFSDFRDQPFGVCIALHDFLNLMWLRNPADFTEMPAGRLSMECAAMLTPSPEVWAQYSSNLAKLEAAGEVSAETVAIALYSAEARLQVALTDARGEGFDGKSVRDTVERIEGAVRAEVQAERAEKLAAVLERDQLAAQRDALELELSAERESKSNALGDLSEHLERVRKTQASVRSFGIALGRVLVGVGVIGLALVLAWYTLLSNPEVEAPWNWLGAVVIAVLAVIGVGAAWSRLAVRIGGWVESGVLALLNLNEPGDREE